MAMHLGIIPTSTCLLPPLIRRRAAAVHQRKPNHPAPVAFTFHNKSCRFSRLIAPIRSAAGSSGSVPATTYKDITNYLEKVEVFDLSRKAVQIVDLWRDRKAVVAFARHFGCVLCRKRADVLASKKDISSSPSTARGLAQAAAFHIGFPVLLCLDPAIPLTFLPGILSIFTWYQSRNMSDRSSLNGMSDPLSNQGLLSGVITDSSSGRGSHSGLVFPKSATSFNIAHAFSTKMSRSSYLIWKSQFLDVLAVHEILHVVQPDFLPPAAEIGGEPNPDFGVWTRLNRLVLSWIRATLSEDIQHMLLPCTSVPEAWSLLEKRLGPLPLVHTQVLHHKLRSLHKEGNTPMTDYLIDAKRLADDLAAAGDPISDKTLCGYVTDGLGTEFQSFMSMLSLRPAPTFDELYSILLNEEFIQNRMRPKPVDSGTAFYSNNHQGGRGNRSKHWKNYGQSSTSRGQYNQPSNRPKSHHHWPNNSTNRGKRGGFRNHAPLPTSNLPPILSVPPSINYNNACQLCDQQGHTARFCPQKGNHAYSANLPEGFGSLSLAEQTTSDWILDSGASHHMTPSEGSMTNTSSAAGQTHGTTPIYWPQP